MRSSATALTVVLALASGCDRSPEAKPDTSLPVPPPPAIAPPARPPATTSLYRLPASARLVAIGDLHGDLKALRATLRLAGAIDSDDHWIGKDLTVVQTGDQLDRGDQDRQVLDVLEMLEGAATAAGCRLLVMNGNHELMNASFDFRYVTPKSFASFAEFSRRAGASAERLPGEQRGRAAVFSPGAAYASKLANHLTVALVGDSLFAHGGVLPAHVDYGLDRINTEAQDFLAGRRALPPALSAEDSPVWTRAYGGDVDGASCQVLGRVLEQVGAKRLIVGHTVQQAGINAACQDRLFRIDVGLSAFYGDNPPQVLEVTAQGTRILTASAAGTTAGSPSKQGKNPDSAVHSTP